MASIVIGLFEHRSDAEAALNDLVSNNFDRAHIDLKEPYTETSQHSLAHLRHELEGEGVPEGDASLFEEGVRAGDAIEIAHTDDNQAELAREIMNRHGALDIHDAFAQRGSMLDAAPIAAVAAAPIIAAPIIAAPITAAPITAQREIAGGEVVVPIVEEQLAVGKREIQRGGVRVFQRVEERLVSESVTLRDETVSVERHAVDRPVASTDAAFAQTADVVLTETHEVPVVAKEARVVEEVVVGKTETDRVETVRDTVRRTDVEVEDITADTVNKRI